MPHFPPADYSKTEENDMADERASDTEQALALAEVRLTALANAAANILHALSGESADTDAEKEEQIAQAQNDLLRAMDVARGAPFKLPRRLFRNTRDLNLVRYAERVIGLEG